MRTRKSTGALGEKVTHSLLAATTAQIPKACCFKSNSVIYLMGLRLQAQHPASSSVLPLVSESLHYGRSVEENREQTGTWSGSTETSMSTSQGASPLGTLGPATSKKSYEDQAFWVYPHVM